MTTEEAIKKLEYLAYNVTLESGEQMVIIEKDDVFDVLEKLTTPDVIGRSEQLCHCGNKEDSRYSPCCSLEHWYDKFS